MRNNIIPRIVLYFSLCCYFGQVKAEVISGPVVNTKVFQSSDTIYLDSDVDLGKRDQGIALNCSIVGNGHTIKVSGTTNDLFWIMSPGVTISNVTLENYSDSPKSNRRVIYGQRSDITLRNCTFKGALFFGPSSGVQAPIKNIKIERCTILCDFSQSVKDSHNQNDVITFRGVHGVVLRKSRIEAIDANRVIKTCRAWRSGDVESSVQDPAGCTQDVLFEGNTILSRTDCGKQMWDMYDGTINARFQRNNVRSYGHTYCFENKTTFDNGVANELKIEQNTITTDWKLFFLNTNKKNDSFVFRKNEVTIEGAENEMVDATGYKKTRDYFAVIGGVKNLIIERNKFFRDESLPPIGTFFIQLESKDLKIEKNRLRGFRQMYVSSDANVEGLTFLKNAQICAEVPECELALSGIVGNLVYQSPGFSTLAVKSSAKAIQGSNKMGIKPSKSTKILLQHPKVDNLPDNVVVSRGYSKSVNSSAIQYVK